MLLKVLVRKRSFNNVFWALDFLLSNSMTIININQLFFFKRSNTCLFSVSNLNLFCFLKSTKLFLTSNYIITNICFLLRYQLLVYRIFCWYKRRWFATKQMLIGNRIKRHTFRVNFLIYFLIVFEPVEFTFERSIKIRRLFLCTTIGTGKAQLIRIIRPTSTFFLILVINRRYDV